MRNQTGPAVGFELLEPRLLLSAVTLVNYGDIAANNVYGASWNTVYLGPYCGYDSAGPDGISGATSSNYATAGIEGTATQFGVGDVIKATYYNPGATQRTYTPVISFDDPDYPSGGSSGTWYNMSQIIVPAGGSAPPPSRSTPAMTAPTAACMSAATR